jgi:hypothetical protein
VELSRRRFFTLSAAAAVLAVPTPLRAALPPPKSTFGEDDLAVLDALKRVLYGPGADELDLRTPLQETLGFLDESQQSLLASLPSTFDLLSRVLVPTVRPYVELDEAAQTAALADWLESPLGFRRQVGQGLRQLVLAHCYTNPAVFASIGYGGPWLGRYELPVHPLRFGEPE